MADLPFRKNPYVGPRAFREEEPLYGRERELQALFYKLAAERVVLFHAPSGAGKTSLIHAKLLGKLKSAGFQMLPPMRVGAVRTPPASPLRQSTANRYLLSAMQSLEEQLAETQRLSPEQIERLSFVEYLRQRPGAIDDHSREMLIFDQFEEILTLEPNDLAAKEQFFAEVGEALYDRRRWALFAIRDEYVGALDTYAHLIPGNLSCRFRLELLDEGAARAAMQLPARAAGVEFTDEAAIALVNNLRTTHIHRPDGTVELRSGVYVEPVQLQVVCRQLWEAMERRSGGGLLATLLGLPPRRQIDLGALGSIGNVDQALANYYSQELGKIVVAVGVSERVLRDWIERRLITSEGLRSQVLRRSRDTEGLPDQVFSQLINAHIVREEDRRGGKWCELAHDRMIEPIKASNAAWLAEHLDPIQQQAALWLNQGEPNSMLLRDDALEAAVRWSEANQGELSAEERRFIDESRFAQRQLERQRREQQRERESARRIRRLGIAVGVLGLICIILALVAVLSRQDAMASEARRQEAVSLVTEQAATATQQQAEMITVIAEATAGNSNAVPTITAIQQTMVAFATDSLASQTAFAQLPLLIETPSAPWLTQTLESLLDTVNSGQQQATAIMGDAERMATALLGGAQQAAATAQAHAEETRSAQAQTATTLVGMEQTQAAENVTLTAKDAIRAADRETVNALATTVAETQISVAQTVSAIPPTAISTSPATAYPSPSDTVGPGAPSGPTNTVEPGAPPEPADTVGPTVPPEPTNDTDPYPTS